MVGDGDFVEEDVALEQLAPDEEAGALPHLYGCCGELGEEVGVKGDVVVDVGCQGLWVGGVVDRDVDGEAADVLHSFETEGALGEQMVKAGIVLCLQVAEELLALGFALGVVVVVEAAPGGDGLDFAFGGAEEGKVGIVFVVFVCRGVLDLGLEGVAEIAAEDEFDDAVVGQYGVVLVLGEGDAGSGGEEGAECGVGDELAEALVEGGGIGMEVVGEDAEVVAHRLVNFVEHGVLPRCLLTVFLLEVADVGELGRAADGESLLVFLEEGTQGLGGAFVGLLGLQVANQLVDGTPSAHGFGFGAGGGLVLYLHVVLSDVGDVEAVVAAEAHEEVAVFLALALDLLDHADPAFEWAAEDADGVVDEDEVAIALVDDAESLDAVGNLVAIVNEAFHVLVGDGGVFDDGGLVEVFHVVAQQVGAVDDGVFLLFTGDEVARFLFVEEVAPGGEDALELPGVVCLDEEHAVDEGLEADALLFVAGVFHAAHRQVYLLDDAGVGGGEELAGALFVKFVGVDDEPHISFSGRG